MWKWSDLYRKKISAGTSNIRAKRTDTMATPHGVANAIILPTVMEYNAPATGEKYRNIAKAMGVDGVDGMTLDEARKAAVNAVKKLSKDVGIPENLKDIVKPEDVDFLAQSAYDDACRPGNPRETSVEEIKELYLSLM